MRRLAFLFLLAPSFALAQTTTMIPPLTQQPLAMCLAVAKANFQMEYQAQLRNPGGPAAAFEARRAAIQSCLDEQRQRAEAASVPR